MNLTIGKKESGASFLLPIEAVTETFAILAKKGYGNGLITPTDIIFPSGLS